MTTSTATGKPLTATAQTRAKAYTINRAAAGGFVRRGLRAYFEYRDLGIEKSSKGKVVAHVIRARPEKAPHGAWHSHACIVQSTIPLTHTPIAPLEMRTLSFIRDTFP